MTKDPNKTFQLLKDFIEKNQPTSECDDKNENLLSQNIHNCEDCDNIRCKQQLILAKINDTAMLASQIGHTELFNIMITLLCALQYIHIDHTCLDKITKASYEVYSELNPKEMQKSIN